VLKWFAVSVVLKWCGVSVMLISLVDSTGAFMYSSTQMHADFALITRVAKKRTGAQELSKPNTVSQDGGCTAQQQCKGSERLVILE
jgi:hypothetical protein